MCSHFHSVGCDPNKVEWWTDIIVQCCCFLQKALKEGLDIIQFATLRRKTGEPIFEARLSWNDHDVGCLHLAHGVGGAFGRKECKLEWGRGPLRNAARQHDIKPVQVGPVR